MLITGDSDRSPPSRGGRMPFDAARSWRREPVRLCGESTAGASRLERGARRRQISTRFWRVAASSAAERSSGSSLSRCCAS
eukprot:2115623-Rhodomonas_salina.1